DPRIHLKVQSSPELWPVFADSSQMNQVVMNLCLNARDAMPEGGELTIEAKNLTVQETQAGASPGENVRLSVSSSGIGIPDEVRPRIFEPFFTTKPLGKGSGLGLALVFGIVQQHEGWVECHSALGQGTRFEVYLPRFVPSASEGQPIC